MMKNLKRAVSILLTFMMLFGTFGAMSVGAEGSVEEVTVSASGNVKTINEAITQINQSEKDSGKIVLGSDITISTDSDRTWLTHTKPITITSAPKMEAKLILNKPIKLGGQMTFENISIQSSSGEQCIYAFGNNLTMGEGISTIGQVSISGGKGNNSVKNINVQIKSGKYYRIFAVDFYGGTIEEDVNLTIGGSTVVSSGLYIGGAHLNGYTTTVNGNINVIINNGSFKDIYVGAASTGTNKNTSNLNNVNIDINGGAISGMIGTKSGATGTTAYQNDAQCHIDFSNFKQTFAHESYAYENWEEAVASLNNDKDYEIRERNDDLAVFAGYQVSLTEKVEGYYNIRFLSVLQGDKHTEAGYNITARYSDKSKTFTAPATAVYTSIVASTATGEMVNVKASDLGGDYILALTITSIPKNVGAVEFEVTPYATEVSSTTTFTHDPAKHDADDTIKTLFDGAESKIDLIMDQGNQYENASPTDNGQKYYVSTNEASNSSATKGTKENPFKTIDEVNNAIIPQGSIVLFERGCEWRMDSYAQSGDAAFLMLKTGVKYSSYGDTTKPKPIINGSPVDAGGVSNAKEWERIDDTNIWRYSKPYYGMKDYGGIKGYLMDDIGNVIFNDGAVYGEKVMSMEELTKNFQFYYKPNNSTGTPANGECQVYLYYEGGNPAEKFDSIEMGVRLNLVRITGGNGTIKNVVFDNFILKNGGAHGIALAKADNVNITNCFIYNMGGGVYNYTDDGKNTGRYGNGVEINQNCKNITVAGNYIYQIYDAGLTHQFDTRTSLSATTVCIFENIKYENNVISHCFYGIEFFVSPALRDTSVKVLEFDESGKLTGATTEDSNRQWDYDRYMKNITISGNYILYSGYGWGYMRDTSSQKGAAHIKTWAHFDNSIYDSEGISISDNNFAFSRYDVICGAFEKEADMPALRDNIFVQSSMGKTITLTLAPLGTTKRTFDGKEYEFYSVDEVPADNRAYWNEAELEATYTDNTFVTAEDINV